MLVQAVLPDVIGVPGHQIIAARNNKPEGLR